ncbi:MAG: MmgE/PrpD family protein [Candidatus Dormibacteraeota bacterium]|uniref:MmgE/PrpD family protein n=2 Tax=Candidatus Dormibacteria TaxID=3126996 RepID=A0A934JW39_9BACT|nr:MmgE/PrpD family protein [Candidatus Dormibacteraeota bacterium]MBJ7603944.1 MmgE/PrpD family protein [Candidatus Dormibacteraeota bacterium]MBJ7607177.1 MmgE/PrpD family protein [Candidatus Dormibacteraeota bacterium]
MSSGLTRQLVRHITDVAAHPLLPAVKREAQRTLLNALGVAVAGTRYGAFRSVVAVARIHGGRPASPVAAQPERFDAYFAALLTGLAAHLDDFDDTHLASVIHPGAATLGASLALGAWRGTTGSKFLTAFALGCEVQLRVGMAISPSHYDQGWHITGTCGVIGAVVSGGLILGLDFESIASALGIAASQTLGHREGFGTHTKAFHPGKAAANGVLAALLAESGFSGSPEVFEAPRGFLGVLAPRQRSELLTDGFGDRWELLSNTYKPYPCGIVNHPGIDAAIALHRRIEDVATIREVIYECHPLVPELMGLLQPTDGLAARFSAAHGVAAGLADGRVSLAQYENTRVRSSDLDRLRSLVRFEPTPMLGRDEAGIQIRLADGRWLREHVDHARGSLAHPLTDGELEAKVRDLIEPMMPGAAQSVISAVGGLERAHSLERLVAAIVPSGGGVGR